MRRFIACLIPALLALPTMAADVAPPAWVVDPAASAIRFSGSHAGSPFNGVFADWKAVIRFAPGNNASNASVTIRTASAETGNALYDGTLPGADWFDAGTYPQARFQSRRLTQIEGDRYQVEGLLTLRDVTKPVSFEATITQNADKAELKAALTIRRLDYGIGRVPDASADWVSDEIDLDIHVTAHADTSPPNPASPDPVAVDKP